jgi:hypothetical protein
MDKPFLGAPSTQTTHLGDCIYQKIKISPQLTLSQISLSHSLSLFLSLSFSLPLIDVALFS